MVLNRKGQGLPINTIILIAVGLLILVLMITFVLGGFKGLGVASPSSSTLSTFASATCNPQATDPTPSLAFSTWCSSTVANPSGPGVYHCYSDLSLPPNNPSQNTTTITLSNGTTVGYSSAQASVNCVSAGYT